MSTFLIGKDSVSLEEEKIRPIVIGTLICRRASAVEMALYGSFVTTGFGYLVTVQLLLDIYLLPSIILAFWNEWNARRNEEIQPQLGASHNKLAVHLLRREAALPKDIVMGVNLLAHPRVIQYSSIPHDSTADARGHAAVMAGQEQLLVGLWGQQGYDLLYLCETNTVVSYQEPLGWTQ